MGQKNEKPLDSKIGKPFKCSNCEQIFSSDTLTNVVNQHIISCSKNSNRKHSFLKFIKIGNSSVNPSKIKDYIKKHKIDWSEGCDTIELLRKNCLEESLEKIEFVDLWRELKITFTGEIASDAGGLLREWFSILIDYK